ncbi:MAG: hypothetical protein JOZ54_19075 [Acidobacteria bacterium]|nr:hypothetical protein [Acidobacteriota bacterium]
MIAEAELLRPALGRYPDGRRAFAPQLPAMLLPYVAMMFGSAIAGLAAFYNAIVIRRFGLAFLSLFLGFATWFGCLLGVLSAKDAGVDTVLLLIGARVLHFLVGCVFYFLMRPHLSGSTFLGGRTAPVRASYFVALAIGWYLPFRVLLLLLGAPIGK